MLGGKAGRPIRVSAGALARGGWSSFAPPLPASEMRLLRWLAAVIVHAPVRRAHSLECSFPLVHSLACFRSCTCTNLPVCYSSMLRECGGGGGGGSGGSGGGGGGGGDGSIMRCVGGCCTALVAPAAARLSYWRRPASYGDEAALGLLRMSGRVSGDRAAVRQAGRQTGAGQAGCMPTVRCRNWSRSGSWAALY